MQDHSASKGLVTMLALQAPWQLNAALARAPGRGWSSRGIPLAFPCLTAGERWQEVEREGRVQSLASVARTILTGLWIFRK